MNKPILIRVSGTPIPKPRMTRYSKADKRRVGRYHEWARTLRLAYREQCGILFKKPVALGFVFRRLRLNCDLDNLIKAVKDALKDMAWPDDGAKQIPAYDHARIERAKSPEDEGLDLRIYRLAEGK